ncbi:MAG: hypothetical protein KKE11_07140, partial [Gammaproteobacteria bacterium]|nr:hypothetical protein [Gammaproteobacteria bacterium]
MKNTIFEGSMPKPQFITHLVAIAIFSFFAMINVAYGQEEEKKSYDMEDVLRKVEQNMERKREEVKNLPYQFKDGTLPKVYGQIAFCHDGSRVWLELNNYESLVNGKESNRLVTVFIGRSDEVAEFFDGSLLIQENSLKLPFVSLEKDNIVREVIEIFDPEAAFVFQDAIVRYWDKLPGDQILLSFMDLAKAFQVGYDALSYHFGFKNSLDVSEISSSINSPKDLSVFIRSLHKKYEDEQTQLNRMVTLDDLKKKEELGFVAYYPNPIYLGEIYWHIRPENMSYKDYMQYGRIESTSESSSGMSFPCDPGIISKPNFNDPKGCERSLSFIKRAYSEKEY